MKNQVLKVGSGVILFESDKKDDCIKWQKEHSDIDTVLWTDYGLRICHL